MKTLNLKRLWSFTYVFLIIENVLGNYREKKPYATAAEYAVRLWPNQTQGQIQVRTTCQPTNYYGLDQIPHANLLVLIKSINFLSSGRNIYTWSCLFILFCTEPVSVHFRRCCFKRAVVQKKFGIFLFHEPKKNSLIVR